MTPGHDITVVSSLSISCVTGIVLAGGRSSRFGKDKGFEPFARENLIERAANQLKGFHEVIVATSAELAVRVNALRLAARTAIDTRAGLGPIAGIHAGLLVSSTEHSLVVACDMPFLNRQLLLYMAGLRRGYDIVVPRVGGFTEPLHAIYSKNCLPAIEKKINAGSPALHDLLQGPRVRFVEEDEVDRFDPRHLSFININSQADMERAKKLALDLHLETPNSIEGDVRA